MVTVEGEDPKPFYDHDSMRHDEATKIQSGRFGAVEGALVRGTYR